MRGTKTRKRSLKESEARRGSLRAEPSREQDPSLRHVVGGGSCLRLQSVGGAGVEDLEELRDRSIAQRLGIRRRDD